MKDGFPVLGNARGITMGCSSLYRVDSYITNQVYYVQYCQDFASEMDIGLACKVMDINLFKQVKDLAAMLSPVAKALDRSQSDKTTIADACDIFFDLLNEPVLRDH